MAIKDEDEMEIIQSDNFNFYMPDDDLSYDDLQPKKKIWFQKSTFYLVNVNFSTYFVI